MLLTVADNTNGSVDGLRLSMARRLADLRAHHSLILAVLDGLISTLNCSMSDCYCPEGRGYFYRKGDYPFGKWAPSADRWRVLGKDGGTYAPENVRLSHWHCNHVAGTKVAGARRAEWNKTPAGRANAARVGEAARRRDPASRRDQGRQHAVWLRTPEGKEAQRRAALAGVASPARATYEKSEDARRARVKGGLNGGFQRLGGSSIGSCSRWNINRGKPCVCGSHLEGTR